MMFEARADLFQVQGVDVVEINHAVRVAHRHAGDLVGLVRRRSSGRFVTLAIGVHGDFSPVQYRFAHVDLDQLTDDARRE